MKLHTHTAMSEGVRKLFKLLEDRLSLSRPMVVYLAGGAAVHLYTAGRATTDVDAEFSGRICIPSDLAVEVTLEDGSNQIVYFDTNYNPTFALMHEDYPNNSILTDLGSSMIQVRVLSPVDLAVSKIARFADNDKEDIIALVNAGLVTANEIRQRATPAMAGYIGGLAMLKINLDEAVAIASKAEAASKKSKHRSNP